MEDLIKKMISVIELIDKKSEKAETKQEQNKLHQVKKMQGRILTALGYRAWNKSKKEINRTPPKNAFKRIEEPETTKIDNSSAPKNAFQYKEPNKESNESFKIENKDVPEDAFKDKSGGEKIKGRKYAGRLSKERKQQIKQLYQEGKTIEAISNELWITEEKIKKELKLNESSNIIADNTSKSIKSEFE